MILADMVNFIISKKLFKVKYLKLGSRVITKLSLTCC